LEQYFGMAGGREGFRLIGRAEEGRSFRAFRDPGSAGIGLTEFRGWGTVVAWK
jgi:hypothetical protein